VTLCITTAYGTYVLRQEEADMIRALLESGGDVSGPVDDYVYRVYMERRNIEVAIGVRPPEWGDNDPPERRIV